AHARGPHLVPAATGWSVVVVRLHLAAAGALEHLRRLRLDVRANGPLVIAPRAMDAEQRNPPLIRPHRVQVHVVLVARQALTVSLQADLPRSRVPQPLLQLDAEPRLVSATRPTFPAPTPLYTVAPHEPHHPVAFASTGAEDGH